MILNRVDVYLNRVDFHFSLVDFYLNRVDFHLNQVDVYLNQVDVYLNQVDGAEEVFLVVEEGSLAGLAHCLQTGHVNHTVDLVLKHNSHSRVNHTLDLLKHNSHSRVNHTVGLVLKHNIEQVSLV